MTPPGTASVAASSALILTLAIFSISAAPALVGLLILGVPEAAHFRSALPADVGLEIEGEPLAVLSNSTLALPVDVGLAIEGLPLTIFSISALSAS